MRLETQNLTVGHSGKPLVEAIDMQLQSGSPHYLIGANGVGKSTLMMTLSGSIPSLAGRFCFFDDENKEMADGAKVLYLQNREQIKARISLEEYLLIASDKHWSRAQSPKERKGRISAVLQQMGIDHLVQRLMYTLSAGEYQKAQLCLPWLLDSRLILLDEPLANLDPISRQELTVSFKELAKDRILFISTHHLHEIRQSGDIVWAINPRGALSRANFDGEMTDESIRSYYR